MSYLLSVDPGTATGISIFDLSSGELIEAFSLKSKQKDTWGARGLSLIAQFKAVAKEHLKHISAITYEKNKRTSVLVVSIPILFAQACPEAKMTDATGITPSEWKAYVRRNVDVSGVVVKGLDALDVLKPGLVEEYSVDSDDAADSILIGFAYLDKVKRGKVGSKRRGGRYS
jgi:hypothetical protein